MSSLPLWDDPARDYRQRYQLPDQFVWDTGSLARIDFDSYMAAALSLLPEPPAQVIDVGCGPGLSTSLLSERGYNVLGLDFNERGIGFARILVPEARFVCADVRLLGEMVDLHGQFDAALHIEVLEHIPPEFHPQVIRGIGCVLKPNGVLVVSVPSRRMPVNRWDYKRFAYPEVAGLVESAGFTLTATVYQHRVSLLSSARLWQLLQNRYYDMRALRLLLRRLFLRFFSTTGRQDQAGRYILQAKKAV